MSTVKRSAWDVIPVIREADGDKPSTSVSHYSSRAGSDVEQYLSPRRGVGRPRGSTNKPKVPPSADAPEAAPASSGRGRPVGSKNQPGHHAGRPKGSTNRPKDMTPVAAPHDPLTKGRLPGTSPASVPGDDVPVIDKPKAGPGRPKGSTNKPKETGTPAPVTPTAPTVRPAPPPPSSPSSAVAQDQEGNVLGRVSPSLAKAAASMPGQPVKAQRRGSEYVPVSTSSTSTGVVPVYVTGEGVWDRAANLLEAPTKPVPKGLRPTPLPGAGPIPSNFPSQPDAPESIDQPTNVEYQGVTHPLLQRKRSELAAAASWVSRLLSGAKDARLRSLADRVKKMPHMPSERVMGELQAINGELYKLASKKSKESPLSRDDVKTSSDARDAMAGMMSAAGKLMSSTIGSKKSNQMLYRTVPAGGHFEPEKSPLSKTDISQFYRRAPKPGKDATKVVPNESAWSDLDVM